MITAPADMPLTIPVLDTVATDVLLEVHALVVAAVAEPVNCVVAPTQIAVFPEIVGRALTVIVVLTVQLLLFVYVIVAVPADTPVTTPVFDTIATAGVPDTHGVVVAAVAEPVNAVVEPTQTEFDPVIVGNAFTVTVTVVVQPLLFVYVITDVPADTPVTNPVFDTVATDGVPDTHAFVVAGVAEPVN